MDVHEEMRETTSEVCKKAFWQRPQVSLDVVWEVLIVVFLIYNVNGMEINEKEENALYFAKHA